MFPAQVFPRDVWPAQTWGGIKTGGQLTCGGHGFSLLLESGCGLQLEDGSSQLTAEGVIACGGHGYSLLLESGCGLQLEDGTSQFAIESAIFPCGGHGFSLLLESGCGLQLEDGSSQFSIESAVFPCGGHGFSLLLESGCAILLEDGIGQLQTEGAPVAQFFEQALEARLQALPGLVSLLGASAIFKTAVPQTWDYGSKGPALTYAVPTKTRGQVLSGSDGTAIANVQLEAFAYSVSAPKRILEAVFNGINGVPGVWGDGSCVILSCVQADETDQDGQPRAGSDQWLYHSIAEYHIKYRVALPTLQ